MKLGIDERETIWSLVQCISVSMDVPFNTVAIDAYILISKYFLDLKSDEMNASLYKIIAAAFFSSLKMNNLFHPIDDVFVALVVAAKQIQSIFTKFNVQPSVFQIISLPDNVAYDDDTFDFFFNDQLKKELINTYELDILKANNFGSVGYLNPFRYVQNLSKKFCWGSFEVCEKITFFICKIIKSNKFFNFKNNTVVAAATQAGFNGSSIPLNIANWILDCKNNDFADFDSALTLCCYN